MRGYTFIALFLSGLHISFRHQFFIIYCFISKRFAYIIFYLVYVFYFQSYVVIDITAIICFPNLLIRL